MTNTTKNILTGLGIAVAVIALFLMALPTILHSAGLHPKYEGETVALPGKRALVITTSHSMLNLPGSHGQTNRGYGFRNDTPLLQFS